MEEINKLLGVAIQEGNISQIRQLVKVGIDGKKADINSTDQYGDSPLHLAVATGNIEAVTLLCELGSNIHAETNNGSTALHWAADNGHAEIVQFLLDKGAMPDSRNKNGKTPLDMARENSHGEVAAILEKAQQKAALKGHSAGGDLRKTNNGSGIPLGQRVARLLHLTN